MKPLFLTIVLLYLAFPSAVFSQQKHTFSLGDSVFLLDSKPFQIISGEMHYPRVPREAWRQRMRMAKAMGLNTISTYVFWNEQEPLKGKYDFTGNNDIAAFIKIAQEEGLWVILRPSPYVCAEWEFGGYPFWLQNEKGLQVRSKEPQYLEAYRNYIIEVGKHLSPLQINHGGNILMVQIENEYGSYGSDKSYLDLNRRYFVEAGFDGLLYTCDPANDVANGHLPGLLAAVNGEDDPIKVKEIIRKNNNGKGPFMLAEWYPAWFDWWGAKHHTVPADDYVKRLDAVLAAGISINMYMFHGGTTRGFMNGANLKENTGFEPQISSYDYDAPLDEAGNPTEKYTKFRAVILKHLPKTDTIPNVPAKKAAIIIPDITFSKNCSLFDLLPKPTINENPLSFESLNQAFGYVLYRTETQVNGNGILKIKGLRDYAIIFVNSKKIGVLDRRLNQDSILIDLPATKATIDILVENMGRINFGPYLLSNKKGITEEVTFNQKVLQNWKMYGLPFDNINEVHLINSKPSFDHPVLRKGSFTVTKIGDTYLDMSNWGKGCVWVNGHHLGRYWNIGPQQTVYLPAEWIKEGKNDIVVLELLKPEQTILNGILNPILDKLQ